MTIVRRQRRTLDSKEGSAGKSSRTTRRVEETHRRRGASGPSTLAQVRLRSDEMDALRETMRTLNLTTTSDALREGLRLLSREAAEWEAAEQIQAFYEGAAPVPEGVAPVSEADLKAADEAQW